MAAASKLPAIILAAGLSSRMGAFKPLLVLRGKPVLQHVISSLRNSEAISEILVVTGHGGEEIDAFVAALGGSELRTLFNPAYATGEMLSSLLVGISALSESAPAFVLALGDQPAVESKTIAQLVSAFFRMQSSPPPLVMPTYLGKRGHPVVISTSLVPEIRSLPPGESLKTVVHRHLACASSIAVNDPSIHDDLDTPADFARAQAADSSLTSHPAADPSRQGG